jgi:DNA transformation protein
MPHTAISDLPNLGPKSAAVLASAGVQTLEDLQARGAVNTYAHLIRAGAPVNLNLLWAMEGALTGRHWQEVAREDRLRLLTELEAAGVSA